MRSLAQRKDTSPNGSAAFAGRRLGTSFAGLKPSDVRLPSSGPLTPAQRQLKEALERSRKRSKYGSCRIELDGQTFDSKLEAAWYAKLKLQERVGDIRLLARQHSFPLYSGDKLVGYYRADFTYYLKDGTMVIADAKGGKATMTRDFRLKSKMIEALYGVPITILS